MRTRRGDRSGRRFIPWLPVLVAAALGVAALALEAVDPRGGLATDILVVPILLAYGVVGGLIGSRQPRNAVAWLLDAMSILMIGAFFVTRYAIAGIDRAPALPGVEWIGALGWLWMAALACPVLLAFVVPTGRPASPNWGRVMAAVAAAYLAVLAIALLGDRGYELIPDDQAAGYLPNPFFVPALESVYEFVNAAFALYIVLFVAGAVALVARFRRARGAERQQLKWIVTGIVVMIVAMAGSNAFPSPLSDIAFALAMLSLPVALAIAMLRFRLYDIDRIISRTVAYAVVTGVLAATFAAIVLVAQAVLAPVTQSNNAAVAASTLVVAALFQPLRRRVQAVVDRRFNRRRADADLIVDAFGARLRDNLDVEALAAEVRAVAVAAVQPASAGVWLAGGEPG
jgi:hypothetical protein